MDCPFKFLCKNEDLQHRDLSDLKEQCFDIVGPQCVPRRIYSITTGSSRSQLFVAVEGTDPCSANMLICISYKDRE